MADVRVIGKMDHTIDNTFESANRVYDKNGLCPTIPTCCDGGHQAKIIVESERQSRIKAKTLPNGNIRFYQDDDKKSAISEMQLQSGEGVAQTVTTNGNAKIIEQVSTNGTDIAGTIRATYYKNGERNLLENIKSGKGYEGVIEETKCVGGFGDKKSNGGRQHYQQDRVYKGDIALAQPANLSGGSYNYLVKQATKKGYIECEEGGVADLSYPSSKLRRGRVQDGGNTSPAITTHPHGLCRLERFRIRKLTPRECWRLMGFSDEDFEKAASVNSNSQLYKQAGNSIVVSVLEAIFRQMI